MYCYTLGNPVFSDPRYTYAEKVRIRDAMVKYYNFKSKKNFCYHIKRYLNWCYRDDVQLPPFPIDDLRINKYFIFRTNSIAGSSFENEKSSLHTWSNIVDVPWQVSSIKDDSNNATFI